MAYELYDKADAGISAIGRQDAVQHRMALHADLHLNPQWRIFGKLGYALVNGRDGGAKVVDETDVDIWRACLPVISLKMRVAKTAIISISDLMSLSGMVEIPRLQAKKRL